MAGAPLKSMQGRFKSGKKYKVVKPAKLGVPMKKAINRIVNSKYEKKFATEFANYSFNSSISNTGGTSGFSEFYSLIPEIITGSDNGERVGDTIRPTHMMLNLYLTASDYASSFSGRARVFVLEDLNISDVTLHAVGLPNADMLLDQGGLATTYNGGINQHMLPVNKERFRVLADRTVRLQKGTGEQGNLGNTYTGDNTSSTPANSVQLKIRLPTKKVWKYETGAKLVPSNQAIWIAIGYVNDNGVADNTIQRVTAWWNSTVYYTDA